MQRRHAHTSTAAAAARPAAEVATSVVAGVLFVLTPLAVATAPALCLTAVAAAVALSALHRSDAVRVTVLRATLARVAAARR